MKILTAHYESSRHFLEDVRVASGILEGRRAVRHATRAELAPADPVLMEVAFPGLPNRVILRGTIAKVDKDEGRTTAYVTISQEDYGAYDFLVSTAQGEAAETVARRHDRVPLGIPVDWQVVGSGDLIISATDDVSGGGVQIRTLSPPPVGTKLTLRLVLDPRSGEAVSVPGQVVWVRQDAEFQGMGVKFLSTSGEKGRRVRELVRKILETGQVGSSKKRDPSD